VLPNAPAKKAQERCPKTSKANVLLFSEVCNVGAEGIYGTNFYDGNTETGGYVNHASASNQNKPSL